MNPTTSNYYATCPAFSLPEQTDDSPIPYVPKIIVCDNSTNQLLSSRDVRYIIQLSAIQDIGYQCLTERRVILIQPGLPMAQIEPLLNLESVPPNTVMAIFRNHRFNSFSLFSLLPRQNTQSMTEALPPVSNDGTQASASASMPVQEDQHATSSQTGLTAHPNTTSHNASRYKCDKCGKECRDWTAFKYHADTHSLVNQYECPLCKKKYKHSTTLCKHMKNQHTDKKS